MIEDIIKKYDGDVIKMFDAYHDKFGEYVGLPITDFAHGNETDFVFAVASALDSGRPLDLNYWYGEVSKDIIQ